MNCNGSPLPVFDGCSSHHYHNCCLFSPSLSFFFFLKDFARVFFFFRYFYTFFFAFVNFSLPRLFKSRRAATRSLRYLSFLSSHFLHICTTKVVQVQLKSGCRGSRHRRSCWRTYFVQ